jgi:hypothetical protein
MIKTLRDYIAEEERITYAMYAPEVGILAHNTPRQRFYAYIGGQCVERRTREELAALLVRAWDNNVPTGA